MSSASELSNLLDTAFCKIFINHLNGRPLCDNALIESIILSTSSFARDYSSISINDGSNILRIDIGNDRDLDARQLVRRITKLERAVRELQNRVYDLEDDATPNQREVTVYTCALPTAFDGTFVGKGKTAAEARANAVNACHKGGGFPCSDDRVKSCETSVELETLRR